VSEIKSEYIDGHCHMGTSEPKAKPFNHVGRGIELTEAGYVFCRARNLSLRGWKRQNSPLNEFGSLKRGAIIVQASQTIVSYWRNYPLPFFRAQILRNYPQF
jgi:DNA-binding transcriptional LysR family regulator